MNPIGGYFELELSGGPEYHPNAVRLNSGRNALEYVLIAKEYKKIYLPFYTCNVLLEPLERNNISYEYYSIDENFEADFDFSRVKSGECFLYTNYFGFKDRYIRNLAGKCNNLVIDNAQAFYSRPVKGIDTFYSPRKFFGVPDGAYLYTNAKITRELDKDHSYQRFSHLLKRIDLGSQKGYGDFVENDKSLSNLPVMEMSGLTKKMLESIDYQEIAQKRRHNYNYLARKLSASNKIGLEMSKSHVPMTYPFLSPDLQIRNKLMENKIFTAQYWKEAADKAAADTVECLYANELVHLPVDQRYGEPDLLRIIDLLL